MSRRLALGLVLVCCCVGGCAPTPAPTVTSTVTLDVWPQVTRVVMPEDLDRCG
jgi:hypothetical protein